MTEPLQVSYRAFVENDLPRPYVGMYVTGPSGQQHVVFGIVDSGADSSSFPLGYAELLGYDDSMLKDQDFQGVGAKGTAKRARVATHATIPEIADVTVEMFPDFIPDSQLVLWGQADFLLAFNVRFERSKWQLLIEPAV